MTKNENRLTLFEIAFCILQIGRNNYDSLISAMEIHPQRKRSNQVKQRIALSASVRSTENSQTPGLSPSYVCV